jgi:DNA-binding CsgD family transcriptional regulator/PAS domain-containing protein
MPKFDASRFAGLIDPIYEAAASPELWRGLLAEIADAAGAFGAAVAGTPNLGLKSIGSESLDEILDEGRRTGWLPDRNARLPREWNAFRQGQDIETESTIFSPWELDHLPFNTEFVTPHKGRSFAAMRFAVEGPSILGLEVERLIGSEPFTASEIETMRALLPHMQRAGQLVLRLMAARQEGLLDALAAFDCGALLLDWRGQVLRMNAKAEAMMGPGIAVRAGMLTAAGRDCGAAVQRLIGSVIARGPLHQAEPIGAVPVARPGKRPLIVRGAPLARSAQDLFHQARAVLMIDDPEAQQVPQAPVLRQVFGLTGAEASVAIAHSSGRDVEEIARMMRGVSIGTLRNQLKTICAKTDTRRQAELVALLLRYSTAA